MDVTKVVVGSVGLAFEPAVTGTPVTTCFVERPLHLILPPLLAIRPPRRTKLLDHLYDVTPLADLTQTLGPSLTGLAAFKVR